MQAAGLALAQRVEKPRPLPQIFKGAESLFYILSKLNQVGVAEAADPPTGMGYGNRDTLIA